MTEIDLTPSEADEPVARRNGVRNWLILGGIAAVLVFVLVQALTSARVFFYNVDEAVAQQAELGDQTFRMQGVVVTEPETDDSGRMSFTVNFNEVDAEVVHIGEEPSDLFELGQAVVVEGRWERGTFTSSQILVKHSESYVAENEGERPGVDRSSVG